MHLKFWNSGQRPVNIDFDGLSMERILGEMHSLHTSMETTTDEETFSKFCFFGYFG